MNSYANITLKGPALPAVVQWLNAQGQIAYVAEGSGAVVVFHADLAAQEGLASTLSKRLECPALLVMTYGTSVLLYQLYESGDLTDSYVSEVHEELEDVEAAPGDAERLCDAFSRGSAVRRVKTLLGKRATEGNGFILGQNRHGELMAALALPTWAAGIGFESIQIGEMPGGGDVRLVRAGG